MQRRILYCGDTSSASAAAYLCGLMDNWRWSFDYIPSDRPLEAAVLEADHDLFIFSDYPAAQVSAEVTQAVVNLVQAGAGLLMIGGWESFHGLGGHWDRNAIGQLLPVSMDCVDDRRNCDHVVLVRSRVDEHPITDRLPWNERPPLIGGFNQVTAKPDATVLLEAFGMRVSFASSDSDRGLSLSEELLAPLLVVGTAEQGRTAAFMSDIAPHWIGPMVDWGAARIRGQAPGAEAIEVGDLYAQFFRQLLEWCRGERS